jgi:hypothetical protein
MKTALLEKVAAPFSRRLQNDEVKIKRLLKRVQSPRCSKRCLIIATKELSDLTLDVRLIMAIRRRMLARLK